MHSSKSPTSWLALYLESAALAMEMQQVVLLRLQRFWTGGALARREAARATSEKLVAVAAAGTAATISAAAGRGDVAIARQAVRGYRSRVKANRRRLTRPRA